MVESGQVMGGDLVVPVINYYMDQNRIKSGNELAGTDGPVEDDKTAGSPMTLAGVVNEITPNL
jgi:hypothetical protein